MIKPIVTTPAASVTEAIETRRSVRAFLPEPVSRDTIRKIIELAGTAPSGTNTQPWLVHVLTGRTLARVAATLKAAYLAGEPQERDYTYYTDPLFDPYLARRRACGWGLYGLLGIERGEKERMKAQQSRNYEFFGAPAALVFTMDRRLQAGSYIDYGIFLQTIMLAARGFGLHTCPQASIAEFPDLLRRELSMDPDQIVLAGMAMGFADPAASINSFQPDRESVDAVATFHD